MLSENSSMRFKDLVGAICIAGIICVLILEITRKPFLGMLQGVLVGGFYYFLATRKYYRRKKLAARPFPEKWRKHLQENIAFYRKLDSEGRKRFENNVRFFIAEQKIYGLRGMPVSDEVKLFIAASAAILGHGLPHWEWPAVRDILVYPTAFDENYEIKSGKEYAGIVHQQGPIIFSERDLRHGFCNPENGLHVGLHELAHVMDMANGRADGIPAGLKWVATAPWVKIMADRIQKVRRKECRNLLRAYAGVNEAEFFAVAVEVFFEQPRKLREKDPELYALLAGYFHVNPESGEII